MSFFTHTGDTISIDTGVATLVKANGATHELCFADVTCSAFKLTSEEDAENVMTALEELLPAEATERRARKLRGCVRTSPGFRASGSRARGRGRMRIGSSTAFCGRPPRCGNWLDCC